MFAPQGWLQGRGNRSVYRTIAGSEFFDKAWYLGEHLTGLWKFTDPIWHYIRRGWREGTDPSPRFDTEFYLSWNKDVRESLINPLDHYLNYGSTEGRPNVRPLAQWWPEDLAAVQPIKFYSAPPGARKRISVVLDAHTPNRWLGDHALLVLVAQWIASHLGWDLRCVLRNDTVMPSIDRAAFHWPQDTHPIQVTRIPEGIEYSDIERYGDEVFLATSWSSATSLHNSVGGKNLLYIVTANEPASLPGGDAKTLAHQALSLPDASYLLLGGADSADLWPSKGSKPKKVISPQGINLGSFIKSPQVAKTGGPIIVWAGKDALAGRVRSVLSALEHLIATNAVDPGKKPIILVGEAAHRVLLLGSHEVSVIAASSLNQELQTIASSSLVIAATGSGEAHPVALCASSIGRNVLTAVPNEATNTDLVELIRAALSHSQPLENTTSTAKLNEIMDFVQECGKSLSP